MSLRRVISLVLLVAYLPACTSFQATSQPLASLTAQPEAVDRVRVKTANDATLDVWAPRVSGDTLRGFNGPSDQSPVPVAIPLASIRVVEVKNTDTGKTLLLIGGIAAIFLIGLAANESTCSGMCQ